MKNILRHCDLIIVASIFVRSSLVNYQNKGLYLNCVHQVLQNRSVDVLILHFGTQCVYTNLNFCRVRERALEISNVGIPASSWQLNVLFFCLVFQIDYVFFISRCNSQLQQLMTCYTSSSVVVSDFCYLTNVCYVVLLHRFY